MSNKIKAKSIKKEPYKSLRYRLRLEKARLPQRKGFFRRVFRLIFNAYTFSFALLAVFAAALVVAYFWNEYSEKIDGLLRGDIFTRNAGVYSAPKLLRDGEGIAREDLIKYLTSAGYIEKNQNADEKRSRYLAKDDEIEIFPGEQGIIDGRKNFPALAVKFSQGRENSSYNNGSRCEEDRQPGET
jgi:hypothetical protein